MARITKDRIYEQDLFEPLKKQARETLAVLDQLTKSLVTQHKELVKISKAFDGTAKSQRDLLKVEQESERVLQQKQKTEQQAIKTKSDLIRLEEQERKIKEKNLKLQQEQGSEYSKQSKRLNQLRKEYKDLILIEGKETAELRAKRKEILLLDSTLKKVDATVGQHQRSVGNYERALGGVKNMLGQLGVAFGVFNILRDTFSIITQSEDAFASLSAITGLTGEKFDVFKTAIMDTATELNVSGTVVAEAAEKIASAQPALLDDAEALASVTEQAIILNKAIKGDLTETSMALVGVMNQFSLGAEEASRVINILAAGSQAGAATVNQINESMVKFGTTAKLMNISVEESVGLIETLGEKAIFGSDAGTALRNILLKMGSIDVLPKKALDQLEKYGVNTAIVKDTTLSLEERLTELSKIAKDSTAIMQVFGTENATAATVLLNSLDTYDKMTEAVTGTNTAVDQAAINSDTLSGVIGELRAAWENLVIKWSEGTDVAGGLKAVLRFIADNLETIITWVIRAVTAWGAYRLTLIAWNKEGNGVIQNLVGMVKSIPNVVTGVKNLGTAMKSIPLAGWVAILTTLLPMLWDWASSMFEGSETMKALVRITEKYNEKMVEEKSKMELLYTQILQTNAGSQEREVLINKINSTYGTTLQNLEDETAFMQQLAQAYREVTAAMEKKIMAQILEEELTEAIKKRRSLEQMLEQVGDGAFSDNLTEDINEQIAETNELITNLQKQMFALNQTNANVGKTKLTGVRQRSPMKEMGNDTKETTSEVKKLNEEIKNIEKTFDDAKAWQAIIDQLGGGIQGDEFDPKGKSPLLMAMEAEAERLRQLAEEQKALQQRIIDSITESIKNSLNLIAEMMESNLSKIDRQIEQQEAIYQDAHDREDELRRVAEERGLNATESIEAEREAQKKAQIEIEKLESKKRQLEMTIAAMKMLADGKSVADIKGNLTDIFNFAKTLPTFYTGTDTTVSESLGKPDMKGKDGYIVRVDGSEKILNPFQSSLTGNATTDEIVNGYLLHEHGKVANNIQRSYEKNVTISAPVDKVLHKKIEQIIVNTAPENQPKTDLGFNAITGHLYMTYKDRLRSEKVSYKTRK